MSQLLKWIREWNVEMEDNTPEKVHRMGVFNRIVKKKLFRMKIVKKKKKTESIPQNMTHGL